MWLAGGLIFWLTLYTLPFLLLGLWYAARGRSVKRLGTAWGVLLAGLLLVLALWIYHKQERAYLREVGTYYLASYPGCDSARVVLRADKTYQVYCRDTVITAGTWRFESGMDYWITTLEGTPDRPLHAQLGTGAYQYTRYESQYP